ncbi:auxin efflux carrier [Neurospora tetraspora]|uniref:Auxin efflux carrier n=1 Tax=Neurospora tetraspora TaxID=94610 RepID=A0AAE0MQA1_9PEZI|nr:auxin efflux carrier [Neurospora tetraspora]
MASSDILVSFMGAVQAAISVLITIWIGVLAAQFDLIDDGAAKRLSSMCVTIFLPLLLVANLGKQLDSATAMHYLPIVVWSLIFVILSIIVGKLSVRLFKMPAWTTPALAFNNSTSLPLLLIQALDAAGVLKNLTDDPDVVEKARSYFLVCAVISNTLTFGYGPALLEQDDGGQTDSDPESGRDSGEEDGDNGSGSSGSSGPSETTSLLPKKAVRFAKTTTRHIENAQNKTYNALPGPLQKAVSWIAPFFNPPALGASTGVLIGLVPALHRMFFNDSQEGGYFKAWLTTPIKNTGELFVTLQVIIVGVKLSLSLRKMKEGDEGGRVPWPSIVFILAWRFLVMPALSIPIIWVLAKKTGLLFDDPVLWFTMMMMPIGPPAMRLVALADVNNLPQQAKMATAKLLTISYIATPLIAFSVVGALRAAQNVSDA